MRAAGNDPSPQYGQDGRSNTDSSKNTAGALLALSSVPVLPYLSIFSAQEKKHHCFSKQLKAYSQEWGLIGSQCQTSPPELSVFPWCNGTSCIYWVLSSPEQTRNTRGIQGSSDLFRSQPTL